MSKTSGALVAVLVVLLVVAPSTAGLLTGSPQGEALVGFDGPVDLALLRSLGATPLRTFEGIRVAHVWSDDLPALGEALALQPGVSFVERDDRTRIAGAWDGVSYSASSWDASSWDASSWDASSWDASSWDASSWDASSWDASSWDASSWDASSWDASSWDASSWDASSWDASSWDASSWDGGMDPGFPHQWGLGAANFLDAWRLEQGRGRVGVCVLDTGVDASHADLRPQLLTYGGQYGANAMLGGGSPADNVGHGTHVAGIVAAVKGNATGVAGAAREPVLSVKVMDTRGGRESDLAAGLDICVKSGARIASMSLHIDRHSPTVERAVKAAQAAGLLVVAAAGNDGATSVRYPAAYPGVVAVGSVSPDGSTSAFSNRGERLDVLAPGDHIASTYLGGAYRSGSGTSQATPFVAAAAALVWERDPTATPQEVRGILLTTARDLGPAGRDDASGWGALDAGAAVAAAG